MKAWEFRQALEESSWVRELCTSHLKLFCGLVAAAFICAFWNCCLKTHLASQVHNTHCINRTPFYIEVINALQNLPNQVPLKSGELGISDAPFPQLWSCCTKLQSHQQRAESGSWRSWRSQEEISRRADVLKTLGRLFNSFILVWLVL